MGAGPPVSVKVMDGELQPITVQENTEQLLEERSFGSQ